MDLLCGEVEAEYCRINKALLARRALRDVARESDPGHNEVARLGRQPSNVRGGRELHQAAPEGGLVGGLQRERAGGAGALRQGAQGLYGRHAHGGGHGRDHEVSLEPRIYRQYDTNCIHACDAQ